MLRTLGCLTLLLALLVTPALPQNQPGPGPTYTNVIQTATNETTTGTMAYRLAKLTAGTLMRAGIGDTAVDLYVVITGQQGVATTTGNVVFNISGLVPCEFDAANASGTSGWYVVASTTTPGKCHAQSTAPANGIVVGKMFDDSTSTAANATSKMLAGNQVYIPGSTPGPGSVSSVALTMPSSLFSVSGSPVTAAGTLATTLLTQTANLVFAGPVSGGAAAPTMRALVAADLPATTAIGAAGGGLGGNYPNPNVLRAQTTWSLTGEASPATLSGDINDYSLCTGVAVCRVNGGAADRNWTGLAAPAEAETKELCNIGTTNTLVLKDQNASSSPANRFLFGGDITIPPNGCKLVRYDPTTTVRWRSMDLASGAANPTATIGAAVVNGTSLAYMRADAAPPLATKYQVRTCSIVVGDGGASSPALADDNDTPHACPNRFGADWVIDTVTCYANAGSPTVNPILTGQGSTSILTGALTCGTGTETAGTVNGTPTVHSFTGTGVSCPSAPCMVDMNILSAGGTAKYIVVTLSGKL